MKLDVDKKYILRAENQQEAVVIFYGWSIKEALSEFDSEYSRNGWKITIRNIDRTIHIKKTYR